MANEDLEYIVCSQRLIELPVAPPTLHPLQGMRPGWDTSSFDRVGLSELQHVGVKQRGNRKMPWHWWHSNPATPGQEHVSLLPIYYSPLLAFAKKHNNIVICLTEEYALNHNDVKVLSSIVLFAYSAYKNEKCQSNIDFTSSCSCTKTGLREAQKLWWGQECRCVYAKHSIDMA